MHVQARASADIVLTEPGLTTIVDAIMIARRIFRRISNFLNYRIAATLQLLVFFFIAVFAFAPRHYDPTVSHILSPRACVSRPRKHNLQIHHVPSASCLGYVARLLM
jgi:cation transport ATPase